MKDNLKPFRSVGVFMVVAWLAGISVRAATHPVGMHDFFFSPAVININVGDSVTWTVIEGNHDTTSGNPPDAALWESDLLLEGETFTFQFSQPGSFPYSCAFHFFFNMTGAVQVASGPGMTPPTVNLTSPANNTVSNQTANLDLAATAADSDGTVVNVKFFLGANLVGLDETAPYAASVRGLPPGSYSLTAVATDNDGLSRTSAPVNVTVRHVVTYQGLAFTPSALTVLRGESVLFTNRGGIHTVSGTGSDAFCGSPAVSFCLRSFPSAGFFPYRCVFHSSQVSPGNFAGMTGAVTVANSVVRPPSILLASPTNGQVFASGAPVPVRAANVFDPDGQVLAVMFLVDGVPAGGDVEAPFEAELTGLASGLRVLTAVAMDNAGLSTTSAPVTLTVSAPPEVRLSNPTVGEGGLFQFQYNAQPGRTYVVEGSVGEDTVLPLTPLQTNVAGTNLVTFTDPERRKARAYRVRLEQ